MTNAAPTPLGRAVSLERLNLSASPWIRCAIAESPSSAVLSGAQLHADGAR
jgi:hypothetical protein